MITRGKWQNTKGIIGRRTRRNRGRITENITGWTIERIGKVELTILRLAVFEIKYDDEVPVSVAINEAVELAKKYGQNDSSSFVNGVLAKLAKA